MKKQYGVLCNSCLTFVYDGECDCQEVAVEFLDTKNILKVFCDHTDFSFAYAFFDNNQRIIKYTEVAFNKLDCIKEDRKYFTKD